MADVGPRLSPRRHLIISGTGRAGTTFLVQLLTELGLDTGFADAASATSRGCSAALFQNCDAGMEIDIRQLGAPYVVKTPFLCDYLDEVVEGGEVAIDHAIIPVRDLFSAAESRRDVTARTDPTLYPAESIPGGLWRTRDPREQEAALTEQLYKLIFAVAKHDIPSTLLHFPRIVREPEYLYRKLSIALDDVDHGTFLQAFGAVSRPELVHDFSGRR